MQCQSWRYLDPPKSKKKCKSTKVFGVKHSKTPFFAVLLGGPHKPHPFRSCRLTKQQGRGRDQSDLAMLRRLHPKMVTLATLSIKHGDSNYQNMVIEPYKMVMFVKKHEDLTKGHVPVVPYFQ